MVTASCLCKHCEMFLKHRCFRERYTVNSAKLMVVSVASPVCACAVCKFNSLNRCNAHKVRTCAKVCKIALLIKADVLAVIGMFLSKFNLVRLVHLFKHFYRLVGSKLKTLNLNTRLNDFLHLCLDFLKVFGCKRLFNFKIIVKTVVNGRADSALGTWI